MTLLDEYTRQCLAIQVERQLTATQVLDVLAKAMARYGIPGYIRSDNGPEFIAAKVQQWLSENRSRPSTSNKLKSLMRLSVRERVTS